MVTRARPGIDFSTFPESDGEPMAETSTNAIQMIDLQWTLQTLFDRQGRLETTTVGGNQMMYYNEHNGWEHISPDVYVGLNRPPPAPSSWKTWIEGKFPDIVFEITSPSTQREDLSTRPRGKLTLYERLGVREYYIYDPQQEMVPSFYGFELREGLLEPLARLASGGIMSPLLGAELRPLATPHTRRHPAGTWLRVFDPWTAQPIQIAPEEHDDFLAAVEQLTTTQERLTTTQERLTTTQERLTTTQEQVTEEARARLLAERRVADEAAARLAAEARAAQAEATLQKLLADLGPGQGPE